MKDKRQNVSFDRWLIRVKDLMLIAGTILGALWTVYKTVNKIEQLNQSVMLLEQQMSALQQLMVRPND